MADYLIKDTTLEGIADAIREKRGTSEDIFTEDFADEIMQISGGGSVSHLIPLFISANREGLENHKTKVLAGKYIAIIEQGQLSSISNPLNSSGTEIFSFQSVIVNSRYCFIKEFELEEDGWIDFSGGYSYNQSLTTRRYLFKVDFDLNENILEDIKIENAWETMKTLSTQDSKVFICVMNTEETGVADITSTQNIDEKYDFGCACFAYDDNDGSDYTLSSINTNAAWTTNVYWAFSIV